MKAIIIQGSARSKGNTYKVNQFLQKKIDADFLDLKTKHILPYDYSHDNAHDDFIPLMESLVDQYNLFVFTTPIYWYSMSGIMKTFFDRISDCVQTQKHIGKKLKGKNMAAISCGSDSALINGFFEPFKMSADYLGMNYNGHLHTWIGDEELSPENKLAIEEFASLLQ